jgi:hypothetical protein
MNITYTELTISCASASANTRYTYSITGSCNDTQKEL